MQQTAKCRGKGPRKDKGTVTQMERKSKMAQRDKIIQYLEKNGSATIRELFIFCDINSPSKRLSEMRELGLIDTVKCEKTNANGETIRFKRYFLRKEPAQC